MPIIAINSDTREWSRDLPLSCQFYEFIMNLSQIQTRILYIYLSKFFIWILHWVIEGYKHILGTTYTCTKYVVA